LSSSVYEVLIEDELHHVLDPREVSTRCKGGGPSVRTVGILNYDIPDDLHRRAKAAAAMRGESLKALVVRALEREVDRLEAEDRRAKP
jgi:predicted HicB family RNase H-like nuclease